MFKKSNRPMSENQIERHVERKIEELDSVFMNTNLSKADYNRFYREIKDWADEMYELLEASH